MNEITVRRNTLLSRIERVNDHHFSELALAVFRYQAQYNPLYAQFLSLLGIKASSVHKIEQIPFLPISLFKSHTIKTGDWNSVLTFSSSGTSGAITSRHALRAEDWYKKVTTQGFSQFYGSPKDFCFLALLPAYLERTGSSLVYMAQHFIDASKYSQSGFFLYEQEQLADKLTQCIQKNIPTLLLGVSFALLDFAEKFPLNLERVLVMETGGMKGRRKEITRQELHKTLSSAFQVTKIHSEYGMTELLSQAYSDGDGKFRCTPTMQVLTREITDPLQNQPPGKIGVLNIIDLANLDTCSFIATDDLGRISADASFEVLGRLDASDLRGCNLMVGEE